MSEEALLTLEEVAKRLRLHLDTARRFVREGKLPATKVGRRYLVPEKALREFIEKGFDRSEPATDTPKVDLDRNGDVE